MPIQQKGAGADAGINKYIECPITHEKMKDPVVAADGHTYERTAIERWLRYRDTSPLTNAVLSHKNLTPNLLIKSLIENQTTVTIASKAEDEARKAALSVASTIQDKSREDGVHQQLSDLRKIVEAQEEQAVRSNLAANIIQRAYMLYKAAINSAKRTGSSDQLAQSQLEMRLKDMDKVIEGQCTQLLNSAIELEKEGENLGILLSKKAERAKVLSERGKDCIQYKQSRQVGLFSRIRKKLDQDELHVFLDHVVFSRYDAVQVMLRVDPSLALKVPDAPFADPGKRSFRMSGLQYAAWALDWHMCKLISKFLEGEDRLTASAQCKEQPVITKSQGHGESYQGNELLQAMSAYVSCYSSTVRCPDFYDGRDWTALNHLSDQISVLQSKIVSHIILVYYDRDHDFGCVPDFKDTNHPVPPNPKKGVDAVKRWLAYFNYNPMLVRGRSEEPVASTDDLSSDLKVVTALLKTRQEQISALPDEFVSGCSELSGGGGAVAVTP